MSKRYFEPLDEDGSYYNGWAAIIATGVDYIGTEMDLGLTWRFAPNTAFDLQGAYLKVGHALDTAEVLNGVHTRRTANDGYLMAARVRLAF